jgi:hypothetical protein
MQRSQREHFAVVVQLWALSFGTVPIDPVPDGFSLTADITPRR